MKRTAKNRLPESVGFPFWLVTIAIFLLGFLFVFAYMFAMQTLRCVSFGNYYLESGLYGRFAWVFGLLFVWNLLLFVAPLFRGKAGEGGGAHFLVNCVALLVIGYVMLRLHGFVVEYEAVYKFADAEWNVSEGRMSFLDSCKVAKPYLGRWSIHVNDSRAGFPEVEMVLNRDLTFQLLDADQEVNHHGIWRPGRSDLMFYYRNDDHDQYRNLRILELAPDKLILEQTWAYAGDEVIEQPVMVELLRLPELEKPESAFDINWDFVFDRSKNF